MACKVYGGYHTQAVVHKVFDRIFQMYSRYFIGYSVLCLYPYKISFDSFKEFLDPSAAPRPVKRTIRSNTPFPPPPTPTGG